MRLLEKLNEPPPISELGLPSGRLDPVGLQSKSPNTPDRDPFTRIPRSACGQSVNRKITQPGVPSMGRAVGGRLPSPVASEVPGMLLFLDSAFRGVQEQQPARALI